MGLWLWRYEIGLWIGVIKWYYDHEYDRLIMILEIGRLGDEIMSVGVSDWIMAPS